MHKTGGTNSRSKTPWFGNCLAVVFSSTWKARDLIRIRTHKSYTFLRAGHREVFSQETLLLRRRQQEDSDSARLGQTSELIAQRYLDLPYRVYSGSRTLGHAKGRVTKTNLSV